MRLALLGFLLVPWVHPVAADPLRSPLWPQIRAQVLGEGPVVFDDSVVVEAPASAEDSMAVPVTVRADAIAGAREVVVFADYNPIPKILSFHPIAARPFIATAFKINMATPVRAAVLDPAGTWHVGGVWVDASGGGCTQPSAASANPAWQTRLGEVHARAWPTGDGGSRLKIRVLHPMDTGLAGNIPAFYLAETNIRDGAGRELARVETFEPVSENPVLVMEVAGRPGERGFALAGRDSDGNEFAATIADGGPAQ